MTRNPMAIVLFTALLPACSIAPDLLRGRWLLDDEPCEAAVHLQIARGEEGGRLEIASGSMDGVCDCSSDGPARLEELRVAMPGGAEVPTGAPRFTPGGECGAFSLPLPEIPPGVERLRVAGRFVALREGGAVALTVPFDQEVPVRP